MAVLLLYTDLHRGTVAPRLFKRGPEMELVKKNENPLLVNMLSDVPNH